MKLSFSWLQLSSWFFPYVVIVVVVVVFVVDSLFFCHFQVLQCLSKRASVLPPVRPSVGTLRLYRFGVLWRTAWPQFALAVALFTSARSFDIIYEQSHTGCLHPLNWTAMLIAPCGFPILCRNATILARIDHQSDGANERVNGFDKHQAKQSWWKSGR